MASHLVGLGGSQRRVELGVGFGLLPRQEGSVCSESAGEPRFTARKLTKIPEQTVEQKEETSSGCSSASASGGRSGRLIAALRGNDDDVSGNSFVSL